MNMTCFSLSCILLLLKICSVFANNTSSNHPKEIEFREGATVEHKYFLPIVRLSVSGKNETVFVPASLSRILNVFDTEQLVANQKTIKRSISTRCMRDVEGYIDGLKKGDIWALKMEDASGRYSTGWFWGNHYWIGSRTSCENIYPEGNSMLTDLSMNSVRLPRETNLKRKSSSPSQSSEYEETKMKFPTFSPFPVDFFMLRLLLRTNFTTDVPKIIHIGICMPSICTNNDIISVVRETSKGQHYVDVEVEAVRSHHDKYEVWLDKTFIVLCLITSLMIIMLFVGTSYDFYLEHLKEQKEKSLSYANCLTNNNQLKLEMNESDNNKFKNGKNGFYAINKTDDSIGSTVKVHNTKSIFYLVVKEILLSFSIRANFRTICDQTVGSDTIAVIHGLKSISMAWVILGHTCIVAFKYSDNMEFRRVIEKDFFFQTISNGAYSVDTFFFISGLLVSFLYFRTNAKGKLDPLTNGKKGFSAGFLHFFGLIFYRFLRLTVPYLITLGIVHVSMKWFNQNSVFEPPTLDHDNCQLYWWRNILYINTLFPVEEMCMLWSWYLSDDTQFYVIGAIILIVSTSHFKSAASVLLTLMVSSWITTSYIAYSNSHRPGSDDPLALFDKIYDKPWTRLGPYLIGMCIGWYLFKKNCQIHMPKLVVIIGWTLSITSILALVYGLYEVNLSPITGAAYSALSHSVWALGLSWIVVACSTGYGGVINKILSATILYPFSRVTYCAYLLHPIIIRAMAMGMDSPLHLGTFVMIIIFLGQVVVSYALAFLLSLTFEAPVVSMLRIMQKIVAFKKEQHRAKVRNSAL